MRRLIPLMSLLLCGAALRPASVGAAGPVSVAARARSLAVPAGSFPRGAVVTGRLASNSVADAGNLLHTLPAATLGRLTGYQQTAHWAQRDGSHPARTVNVQYLASLYRSADTAAAAYGDADATAWEDGAPVALPRHAGAAFTVRSASVVRTVVVQRAGATESEIWAAYPRSLQPAGVQAVLSALARVTQAATQRALTLPDAAPPAYSPVLAQPPVYVAPAGTGPVVESPSLLVPDTSTVAVGTALDPGEFRKAPAPLDASAGGAPALVPAGALARFVRTVRPSSGGALYSSAATFGSVSAATAAWNTLRAANDALRPPVDLRPYAGALPALLSNETAAWSGKGETIIAVQSQNVVIVLAGTGESVAADVLLADALVARVPTWLHTAGTTIVDAGGEPVHLAGLNWYGAEQQDFVPGGLDYRRYQDILGTVRGLGYNAIRLPFSDQLVEQNPVVTAHLAGNPELVGLHALDILDRIIAYAGALGISVILDNHRSEAGWSSEPNGLWYTPDYPETSFVRDWVTLATRYAGQNTVIGADLRNEPHGAATWGAGDPLTDWRAAAERAGDAVLAANPHLLVIVEGVQFVGTLPSYWWGGNLAGVATAPVELTLPGGVSAHDHLVYSAHDYGPDNCGGGCPWFNGATTYAGLAAVWEQYWGYITADPTRSYAAPVWVGEFGTCNDVLTCVVDSTPGSQGQWFSALVRYIGAKHLSWAYWSVNGTQSTGGQRVYGDVDFYGYLGRDWLGPGPYIDLALRGIQSDPGATSGTP